MTEIDGKPVARVQDIINAGLAWEDGGLKAEARVVAGLPTNLRTRADRALKAAVQSSAKGTDSDAFLVAYQALPEASIPKLWQTAARRLEVRYSLPTSVACAAVALALFNLR